MDATVPVEEKQRDWTPMRDYVNEMLRDIKRAHRQREEQLSEAAQNYKKRLEDVAKKHEQLIVAYRLVHTTYNICGDVIVGKFVGSRKQWLVYE